MEFQLQNWLFICNVNPFLTMSGLRLLWPRRWPCLWPWVFLEVLSSAKALRVWTGLAVGTFLRRSKHDTNCSWLDITPNQGLFTDRTPPASSQLMLLAEKKFVSISTRNTVLDFEVKRCWWCWYSGGNTHLKWQFEIDVVKWPCVQICPDGKAPEGQLAIFPLDQMSRCQDIVETSPLLPRQSFSPGPPMDTSWMMYQRYV